MDTSSSTAALSEEGGLDYLDPLLSFVNARPNDVGSGEPGSGDLAMGTGTDWSFLYFTVPISCFVLLAVGLASCHVRRRWVRRRQITRLWQQHIQDHSYFLDGSQPHSDSATKPAGALQ